MKNTALKTAGTVFLIIAAAQLARFLMKVPVHAGSVEVPVWLSAVVAVVMAGLGVWMFRAAAGKAA